jgi:hypothetical protein
VKRSSGDDSWVAAPRENSSMPGKISSSAIPGLRTLNLKTAASLLSSFFIGVFLTELLSGEAFCEPWFQVAVFSGDPMSACVSFETSMYSSWRVAENQAWGQQELLSSNLLLGKGAAGKAECLCLLGGLTVRS